MTMRDVFIFLAATVIAHLTHPWYYILRFVSQRWMTDSQKQEKLTNLIIRACKALTIHSNDAWKILMHLAQKLALLNGTNIVAMEMMPQSALENCPCGHTTDKHKRGEHSMCYYTKHGGFTPEPKA